MEIENVISWEHGLFYLKKISLLYQEIFNTSVYTATVYAYESYLLTIF